MKEKLAYVRFLAGELVQILLAHGHSGQRGKENHLKKIVIVSEKYVANR